MGALPFSIEMEEEEEEENCKYTVTISNQKIYFHIHTLKSDHNDNGKDGHMDLFYMKMIKNQGITHNILQLTF